MIFKYYLYHNDHIVIRKHVSICKANTSWDEIMLEFFFKYVDFIEKCTPKHSLEEVENICSFPDSNGNISIIYISHKHAHVHNVLTS